MKIVYCIAATYNSGGMERVLANKANYLVGKGYDVVIVTTDQRGRQPFFSLDERIQCYDLGVDYEDNNGKSFLNKLIHYPFKQIKHKKRLAALLKSLKADVVISMFCNEASFITNIQDGSRKILEIHFSRFKRLQYGRKGLWRLADEYRSKLDVKIAKSFDRFVVLTEEDKCYWGDLKNMGVIGNARSFILPSPALLENKRVIAVGRYSYQKGFDRLIAAWAKVCQQVDDWTLHLVGDGELRTALQKQIKELNLEEKIILGKAETDMPKVYQDASILALSSHYEGLPMVLLEAQAAGLPIVSFSCKCGPQDVIENGVDGFLVDEGDVDALAEKLVLLIKDEDLRKRMGHEAFCHSDRYAEERIMAQWTKLFSEIV